MKTCSLTIQFFLTCGLLASPWVQAQEGVFLRDPTVASQATLEDRELVLRFPLVNAPMPAAKGVLLVDADPNVQLIDARMGFVAEADETNAQAKSMMHVILEKPLEKRLVPVVALGKVVFWNVQIGRTTGPLGGGWLSFPMAAGQQPGQLLRDAGRVFGMEEKYVVDLRLSDAERAKPDKVTGQVSEGEIPEIRRVVFAMARWQILKGLADYNREEWPRLLQQWPGRHPLSIHSDGRRAAVYYAPNAGFQLEKIEGKWTIVGG